LFVVCFALSFIHCCRNGQYSTNKEVLEELVEQHPLPSIILAHRKLSKLLTGFLDTLLQLGQREAQRQGPGELGRGCGFMGQQTVGHCKA
jgi:hypothetical protein